MTPERLLRRFLPMALCESVIGDLEEEREDTRQGTGLALGPGARSRARLRVAPGAAARADGGPTTTREEMDSWKRF